MVIVGCDFHPGWQQVAVFDSGTGEIRELQLRNSDGEAERFYGSLPWPALVCFEACGNTHWSKTCSIGSVMKCGSGMRRISAPATCASRRRQA